MSMLGIAIRSFRAPAGPSLLHRPATGSKKKQEAFICMKSTGRPQVVPPLDDVTRVCAPLFDVLEKCVKNAYTFPWLSVRTVHPSRVLAALGGATWCAFNCREQSVDKVTAGKRGTLVAVL